MTNNLDETNLNSITASVNRRSLFSLRKNKPSEVKFPTIGGGNDEDYNKWEKEMKVALKSNCDRRDDQVRKIREYLKNHPLSLVPENLDNVDAAFSTPKSLYGDPSHMMKRKKDKLLSLGQYPKPAWFQSSVSH